MEGEKGGVSITFDEGNQIRVLPADKYKETEAMKNECLSFLKKIVNFNDMVTNLTDVLNVQANKIEEEKLKAVGARNRIESETEARKRKKQEFQLLINERKIELERLNAEHESLMKVESEQKLLIEKLSNNEGE